METEDKKPMTLEDLAAMVAGGFNDVTSRMATKDDLSKVTTKIDAIENRISTLETTVGSVKHKLDALSSNVSNYLELSEKRYVELKQRDAMLAQWIKLVAKKVDVPIDVTQFEKI